MELGTRLRNLRKSRKFKTSQTQLALTFEVTKQHISNIETGKRIPGRDLLIRYAKYFDMTLDELLDGTDVNPSDFTGIDNLEHALRRSVFSDLSDDYQEALANFAIELMEIEKRNRQRTLREFVLSMLGDIKARYGEEATNELDRAIDLFVRTGDDSALHRWLRRYFDSKDTLPDQ